MIICSYPGCRRPVPRGQKFCEKHQAAGERIEAQRKAARDAHRFKQRGSAAARGYGRKWQRLRDRFLAEHPFCVECMKKGILTMATDVDHIRPHHGDPGLLYDEDNLQALCHACHSRKTASEDGGFGNGRKR